MPTDPSCRYLMEFQKNNDSFYRIKADIFFKYLKWPLCTAD